MVVFELAVLLAIASIAAFPCWRYSTAWGYLPSASAGFLLVVVMLVAVGDKGADRPSRHGATSPPVKVAAVPISQ